LPGLFELRLGDAPGADPTRQARVDHGADDLRGKEGKRDGFDHVALPARTYQDAIAGNGAARREVLKMIAKREKWLAAKAPKQHHRVEVLFDPIMPMRRCS
jgi:hypothetical protein